MLDDLSAESAEATSIPAERATPSKIDLSNDQPLMLPDSGVVFNAESATLTVIAQDGISLQEMFELNDW